MYDPRVDKRFQHLEKLTGFLAQKLGMVECPKCKSTGVIERLFEDARHCNTCHGLGWLENTPEKDTAWIKEVVHLQSEDRTN